VKQMDAANSTVAATTLVSHDYLTLRIKVGWRRAVGDIFTVESSIHFVFDDLTIQMHLATTKISSEISHEYDTVRGELISSIYIIFK